MTDTRQVLEEAWNAIHDYQKAPWQPLAVGNGMERFRRFLDAEAWTDAALMLVPEGSLLNIKGCKDLFNARINLHQVGTEKSVLGIGTIPALALAQAALRAQEAGDV